MPSNPFPAAATALLLITACATPAGSSSGTTPFAATKTSAARTSAAAKPAQPKVVCEWEQPTGSHISKRVCRPVEQVDRERAATQIDLLRPRATNPPQP